MRPTRLLGAVEKFHLGLSDFATGDRYVSDESLALDITVCAAGQRSLYRYPGLFDQHILTGEGIWSLLGEAFQIPEMIILFLAGKQPSEARIRSKGNNLEDN